MLGDAHGAWMSLGFDQLAAPFLLCWVKILLLAHKANLGRQRAIEQSTWSWKGNAENVQETCLSLRESAAAFHHKWASAELS